MFWSNDDHQTPFCFFTTIGFYCRWRRPEIEFERFWWGHRIVEFDRGAPHNLTSIQQEKAPYVEIEQSPIYHKIRNRVPIRITPVEFRTMDSFIDELKKRLASGDIVPVPFPLCWKTGFDGMSDPHHHSAIIWKWQDGTFYVIDQYWHVNLTESAFRERMAWFLTIHDTIPIYNISFDDSEMLKLPPYDDHLEALELYYNEDQYTLINYVNNAVDLSETGGDNLFKMEHLWKIAHSRHAEAQFIKRCNLELVLPLADRAEELSRAWNNVIWGVQFNSRSPTRKRLDGVAERLKEAARLETEYFLALNDLSRTFVRLA